MTARLSVILPARNESGPLSKLLPRLRELLPEAEVVVVDDGSTDATGEVAQRHGARVLRLPHGLGNGAAVKAGARAAEGEVLVFMDADDQHDPADIPRLLEKLEQGYDMVVGARGLASQASLHRAAANGVYNRLASWMVGQKVADLTSGFRAVRAQRFRQFLYLLPNGFSYPTTITMAFFRAGLPVAYVPIRAARREGRSHLRPLRDGVRFLMIIFKIGTLYSPLKIFGPASAGLFLLGLSWYAYTFATEGRFTNMSLLLFSASLIVFLMGLISEQITALMYKDTERG
ncbi:MAG: glycosyltransferase [Thiobacillaceae bacterium]|nr:glycosyltransferase [Thiobacillaceae bacterium]